MLTLQQAESAFDLLNFRLTHENAKVREYTSPANHIVYWDFGSGSQVGQRAASFQSLKLALDPSLQALLSTPVHDDAQKGELRAHSNYRRFPRQQRGGQKPIPIGLSIVVSSEDGLLALLRRLSQAPPPVEKIDEELLAAAVEKAIRPILIDQNMLNEVEGEGYQHSQIIPKGRQALATLRQASEPTAAALSALSADTNLIHFIERDSAKRFLLAQPAETVRSEVLALLDAERPLAERLEDFKRWSAEKVATDAKAEMSMTVASFLLAVLDPAINAWCKPNVYESAATALIGPQSVRTEPIDRQLHANQFYARALALLKDRHRLPFSDLMHVHIAFYVVGNPAYKTPSWEELRAAFAAKEAVVNDVTEKTHPRNLILYGPPGTGKTYTAIDRAVRICDYEFWSTYRQDRAKLVGRFRALQSEGRIGAVTFHQSYSYEDFVEGIRPIMGEGLSGGIRYECRPGVFQQMCAVATGGAEKKVAAQIDTTKQRLWKMSLGNTDDPDDAGIYRECIDNGYVLLGYGRGLDYSADTSREAVIRRLRGKDPSISEFDANIKTVHPFRNEMKPGDLIVVSDGNHFFRAVGRVIGDYKFLPRESYQQCRPVEWLLVLPESQPWEIAFKKSFVQLTLYRVLWENVKADALQSLLREPASEQALNHVLLIDEINRGNISKIFGELITLIEEDKRAGSANSFSVRLPYSGRELSVPSNLYIIGTMNTADRSIALLDTALRRRFRFEEMMPRPELLEGIELDGFRVDLLMETLNRRIESRLDRDHQLGHSFFMKAESLVQLRDVVVYEIVPLLQEYFYGDWPRIAQVLGGSAEAGGAQPQYSVLQIESLDEDEIIGSGANSARYYVNEHFRNADGDELRRFLDAMLGGAA